MKIQMYLIFCTIVGNFAGISFAEDLSESLLYKKTGNVTVLGIFDGGSTNGCHLQSPKTLEEVASAIWTIEALNKFEYLPGLTLGLTIFESCQKTFEEKNEFLNKVLKVFRPNATTYNPGFVTTFEVDERKEILEKGTGFVAQVRHIVDEVSLVEMVVQVLINLQWMVVKIVAAESDDILNLFSEKARSEGIFTYNQLLVGESLADSFKNSTESDEPEIIVIITRYVEMIDILKRDKKLLNSSKTILAPTDFIFQPTKDLPKNTLVLLPAVADGNILKQFVKGNECHKDFCNHREPTKSPLFIGVAATILRLLKPLKDVALKRCREPHDFSCPDFSYIHKPNSSAVLLNEPITPDEVASTFKALRLDENSNGEMFLYLGLTTNEGVLDDAAIFQVHNFKTKSFYPVLLKINPRLFDEVEIIDGTTGEGFSERANYNLNYKTGRENWDAFAVNTDNRNDSFPVNFEFRFGDKNESFVSNANGSQYYPGAVWRSATWVLLNTCLGFAGLLSILFIMGFMVHRICRADPLEGSPIFIIILMFAVSFIFVTSLCYHFDPLPGTAVFLCTCRALAPSMVFSLLFSLMFSRCLMLAFSENQSGFISHINGYLQSILFLCLMGIQISMTSQAWVYEKIGNYSPTCSEVHSNKKFIYSLIYNCVLLSLLVGIGPFIIRLQRNYKEGLLLALSSFFLAGVWFGWLSCYHFLPEEYQDAAAAVGLNATGMTIIIFAFIPRVYMMVISRIRGHNATCVSSMNRDVLPKVSNLHYKSNELPLDGDLCETFNVGVLNPNFMQ